MTASRPEHMAGVESLDLSDQTIVITGATDGVGKETTLALARLGATIIAHGHTPEKVDQLERELRTSNAAASEVLQADFLDRTQVEAVAEHVESEYDSVDALINNAAAYFPKGGLTEDGVEQTIAVNHLAPFVLTQTLQPLVEAGDGRVVTTASDAHFRGSFEMNKLETVESYSGFGAYSRSKFANVLFTYALADRLEDATATCFHPGFIPNTGLYREGSLPVRAVMAILARLPKRIAGRIVATATDGAATALYLAISPEVEEETGAYFHDMEEKDSAKQTYDSDLQEALWEWSAEVTGAGE